MREGGEWRDSRRGYDSPYRNLLVMQMVQMITKISLLLMQAGVSYNQHRLQQAGYFRERLATNPDILEGLCEQNIGA